MNLFQSLIYGLVAGLAEFLPISSQAHQQILLYLFGVDVIDPARSLFVHIGILFALFAGIRPYMDQIRREQALARRRGRDRSNLRTFADMRLVRNAVLPMIVGILLVSYIFTSDTSLITVSLFLVINGIVLYLPDRMIRGNKDARSMSRLDSYLLAFSGACSALPGISLIGAVTSVSIARGADRQKALNWAFLLSIAALITLSCLDLFQIFGSIASIHLFSGFVGYLISGVCACLSAYAGIVLIKQFTVRNSNAVFAYYCWGTALFTFLIYLTVV